MAARVSSSATSIAFELRAAAFLLTLSGLYLYKLSGGAVAPADTNTSLAYVTKDNVDLYLGKSRFEGSTSAEPT